MNIIRTFLMGSVILLLSISAYANSNALNNKVELNGYHLTLNQVLVWILQVLSPLLKSVFPFKQRLKVLA